MRGERRYSDYWLQHLACNTEPPWAVETSSSSSAGQTDHNDPTCLAATINITGKYLSQLSKKWNEMKIYFDKSDRQWHRQTSQWSHGLDWAPTKSMTEWKFLDKLFDVNQPQPAQASQEIRWGFSQQVCRHPWGHGAGSVYLINNSDKTSLYWLKVD